VVADGNPRQVFNAPVSQEHAGRFGYENIFDGVVAETHPDLGTMTCRVAGSNLVLESPLANKAAGEATTLALRAGDILIATTRPSGISARNILSCRIDSIKDRAGIVELQALCGTVMFCVHITRGALKSLGLERDQSAWIIIKTHSIQFLRT